MVRLEYSPQRYISVPARFVNVQLAELLEHLPSGHLSPAIRPAVVGHGLGVPNPHRVARCGLVGALRGPTHGAVAAVLVQEGVVSRWELEAPLQVLLHLVPTRMHQLGVMPVVNELLHSVLRDQ